MCKCSEHLFSDHELSNECERIALSDTTVTLTMPTRTSPTPEAPSVKNPKTHTSKIHTRHFPFWQLGDTASWRSDAVNTAEMNKTSDSKFIKRTHLHFNLKCQTNMHSFALKSIPIIKQTDRQRIAFVFLISHWTKMSIMLSGNFKRSSLLEPLIPLISVYMLD